MILSGSTALARGILTNLKNNAVQVQPCGIDLTLKAVSSWQGAGTLDFSNTMREIPSTVQIPFTEALTVKDCPPALSLAPGAYIVEFNELVTMPLNVMCHVYPRSSLFRSGAVIHAGVCDSGYRGALGGLLQVLNPHGIVLCESARVAQAVFHEMGDGVGDGYKGQYQGARGIN
ncbi:deoxyuridine 5'-triphosphate nucleotidohydrolase [Polychaeton citri CBS 116435]|uniref:Deoxyuridine 5'-triphosphate nucleotidohydrolase n=1 Tax=Polychaeton citri CBS 116435 TaxID=1314669 RepID=A0A9P4UMK3_9PEZI|nr:deoxyuridine 5'-triphosphate nucleotidohydrolase [Polychaeton citri CBS 116435]